VLNVNACAIANYQAQIFSHLLRGIYMSMSVSLMFFYNIIKLAGFPLVMYQVLPLEFLREKQGEGSL